MQVPGIPLGKDPHRIQDVSGTVNGGDPALHSQRHTQAKNGTAVGRLRSKKQVVKEQSLPEISSGRKNEDLRLIYHIFNPNNHSLPSNLQIR